MRKTKTPPPLVLIVDDERSWRVGLRRKLVSDCGVQVVEASSALEALTKLVNGLADDVAVIVSDERMPGGHGSGLLEAVGTRWPRIKRVLVTGWTDGDLVAESPFLVLDKALSLDAIVAYVCDLACEAA